APSLCKAIQVNKEWRNIVDSNMLVWKKHLFSNGFMLEKELEEQAISEDWHIMIPDLIVSPLPCSENHHYKEIYHHLYFIQQICSNNYESNSASSPPWSSYDPYVPKEGAAGGPPSKTVEIQKKIDDTVEVIRDNLKFVAGRGEKLDNLQDKTGNLCWKVKILLNNLAMSSH
ncbi:5039_t:CDS:2, partial [Entrophospora sp. SA101]